MEGVQYSYKDVPSWDTDDVVGWMRGLDECLVGHIPQFLAHCICGSDLLKMSTQQLEYLKVSQIGHQELLLESIEQLIALENSRTRNITISLSSTLSKKTSQLINSLKSVKKKHSTDELQAESILTRLETAAGVMQAAKLLITWLDHNPSSLVSDYDNFRQEVVLCALGLSSVLQNSGDHSNMIESCQRILKLTSAMMSPQSFSVVEPIELVTVNLSPRDGAGLGFTFQRTQQGILLISQVNEGSPAAECGQIHVGVEIVQINHRNVVAWETSKVVDVLKECGHEVTLILKARTTLDNTTPRPNGIATDQIDIAPVNPKRSSTTITHENGADKINSSARDSSNDSPPTSPKSFEGDTDFSGLQKVLLSQTKDQSFDLRRTSSAPLTESERSSILVETPTSPDSYIEEDERNREEGDEGDDEVDGDVSPIEKRNLSFQERLEMRPRTSSDGKMKRKKKEEKHKLPQVAYRTQIIGGVVVRVPIKPEDQEKPKKAKPKNRSPVNAKKKPASVSDDPLADGDGASGKAKAVFSDAKEITVGGQTTKQVTVSSVSETKDEATSSKKSSNPALMVPCFQLKESQQEGWMNKLGGSGLTPKNWRRRWFVLKDRKLYYYKTSFDISALGIVDLVGYNIETATDMKKKHAFKATRTDARTYYFQADNSEDMLRWMQVLKEATESNGDGQLLPMPASIEASDDEL